MKHPQTYALDRTATEIGIFRIIYIKSLLVRVRNSILGHQRFRYVHVPQSTRLSCCYLHIR